MVERPIGFVPAAGRGVRFGAGGYCKELFPLLLAESATLAPRPVCDLAFSAIARAGAARCVVVVSPQKPELLQVIGAGPDPTLSLAYAVQAEPQGLPHAVRCARPWLGDAGVLLALPDTIILPRDALSRVEAERVATGADLVLGVFPVDEPERLGPVDVADDGSVRKVYDKPGPTPIRNSWGVASWSPAFTELCCRWDEATREPGERVLGHVFEAARVAGLKVRAVPFTDGKMLDIGTPLGLRAALRELGAAGVLER